MARCYLKGHLGSCLNTYMAAAAWTFKIEDARVLFLSHFTVVVSVFLSDLPGAIERSAEVGF